MTVVAPSLYYRLPIFAQDLLVTGMGAMHRWRRNDPSEQRRFRDYLRGQDGLSRSDRDAGQIEFLKETLRFAFDQIPYGRSLAENTGVMPDDINSIEDLSRLPVLEKRLVRDRPEDFRPADPSLQGTVRAQTSGTTGTPMESRYTRTAFARQWACVARLREWHGVRDGLLPHRIQLTGSPVLDPARSAARPYRWNRAARTMLVPVNAIGEESATFLLTAMRNWQRVEVMEGYPSAMYSLALLGRELGIEPPRIPLLITTAEKLTAGQRTVLQEYFGGSVVDQYAASEPSCFVGECEHGNLHLFPESGVLELLPVKEAGPADAGLSRIVVTPFHNTAEVLIRYDTGDMARVSGTQDCPCGRQTLLLGSIEGRRSDLIRIRAQGGTRFLTPALLSTAYYGFDAISKGQIVQVTPSKLEVFCELRAEFGDDARKALRARFGTICGSDIEIEIKYVDSIALGPAGKFRAVIPLEERR